MSCSDKIFQFIDNPEFSQKIILGVSAKNVTLFVFNKERKITKRR